MTRPWTVEDQKKLQALVAKDKFGYARSRTERSRAAAEAQMLAETNAWADWEKLARAEAERGWQAGAGAGKGWRAAAEAAAEAEAERSRAAAEARSHLELPDEELWDVFLDDEFLDDELLDDDYYADARLRRQARHDVSRRSAKKLACAEVRVATKGSAEERAEARTTVPCGAHLPICSLMSRHEQTLLDARADARAASKEDVARVVESTLARREVAPLDELLVARLVHDAAPILVQNMRNDAAIARLSTVSIGKDRVISYMTARKRARENEDD